jgi:hypothetical protein
MKAQTLKNVAVFTLFFFFVAISAQAQTTNRPQTASIPFDFNVGNKSFPPGEYRVERLNPQSDAVALAFKSTDGKMSVTILTRGVQAHGMEGGARLVFNRYGDRYFLSQVWRPSDSTGMELPESHAERHVRRELGAKRPEHATVAFAASPTR